VRQATERQNEKIHTVGAVFDANLNGSRTNGAWCPKYQRITYMYLLQRGQRHISIILHIVDLLFQG